MLLGVEYRIAHQDPVSIERADAIVGHGEHCVQDALVVFAEQCGADVELGQETVKGEIVQCPDCGVELEVVNDAPFELELAPEEEEDWGE